MNYLQRNFYEYEVQQNQNERRKSIKTKNKFDEKGDILGYLKQTSVD